MKPDEALKAAREAVVPWNDSGPQAARFSAVVQSAKEKRRETVTGPSPHLSASPGFSSFHFCPRIFSDKSMSGLEKLAL